MAHSKITRERVTTKRNWIGSNEKANREIWNSCIATEPNEIMIINAVLNRSLSTILCYDFSRFGYTFLKSPQIYAQPQKYVCNNKNKPNERRKKKLLSHFSPMANSMVMRINEWKRRSENEYKKKYAINVNTNNNIITEYGNIKTRLTWEIVDNRRPNAHTHLYIYRTLLLDIATATQIATPAPLLQCL